jgi:hypothetical protein
MASTYFTRTPGSGGNRRTFTFSTWIKRSDVSERFQLLFCANNFSGSNLNSQVFFNTSNQLATTVTDNGTNVSYLLSTQLFRDVSAWYHIVIAYDTTQVTDTNRVKMYVNGAQITALTTATYPTQNLDTAYNQISIPQVIGYRHAEGGTNYYYDGLLANTILIDGQQLTPSSFGQTDSTTGIWKPKAYSGSYGTNGFFLKYENSGSLGTDSSGNGNNFTVTAGTPTQTLDTPSNVFCVINPLDPAPSQTFSNGNLTCSYGATNVSNRSSFAVDTGKWYWEMKVSSISGGGILTGVTDSTQSLSTWVGDGTYSYGYYSTNGQKYNNASGSAYGSSYTANDIINIAFDTTNGKLYFGKNGTWQNSGNPATDTNPAFTGLTGRLFFPATSGYNGDVINYNFGNGYFGSTAITSPYSDGAGLGKFQYSVPTGYYALCTKNINVYG